MSSRTTEGQTQAGGGFWYCCPGSLGEKMRHGSRWPFCPAAGGPLAQLQVSSCPAGGSPPAQVRLSPLPNRGCPPAWSAHARTGSRPHSRRSVLSPLAQVLSVSEFSWSSPHPLFVTFPPLTDCRLESYYLSSLFFDVLCAAFSNFLMLDGRLLNFQPIFFPNKSDWGGTFPFMNQFRCVLPVLKLHF